MAIHQSRIDVPRAVYLGGDSWHLSGLSDVIVLFGKNGSGKSVLLRSWRDTAPEMIHYVTPERTGEMDFQPHFLPQELTPSGRKESSSRNYMPEYRQRIISRIQSYFLTRGDYRGEQKAPAFPSEIETYINGLVTDFMFEFVAAATPPYKLIRATDGKQIGGVDQLSSGEA